MPHTPSITLRLFQPADQQAVKSLVLAGLVEHWGVLDASKNPDLDDIAASYASGAFLVACQDGEIIASGALLPHPEGTAEIVRMSVASNFRRRGIGRMVLDALVEQARRSGCRRIVLETTETWQDAISFYLGYGFHITHHKDGDVFFCMELSRINCMHD